jgi:hypothetical protein
LGLGWGHRVARAPEAQGPAEVAALVQIEEVGNGLLPDVAHAEALGRAQRLDLREVERTIADEGIVSTTKER